MSTWIFQANADRFDIEGFFSVAAAPFTWKVTRYGKEIAVGDKVYLWVAGDGVGVVAEARVLTTVADIESDPASNKFWRDPADRAGISGRVYLQLVRAAASKQVLRRDWFKEDPLLKDMLIMRQASGTNFPLTEDEAKRLDLMWSRVGVDWTWEECLAGLWAYAHTLGG
jgi:hypothetical protein